MSKISFYNNTVQDLSKEMETLATKLADLTAALRRKEEGTVGYADIVKERHETLQKHRNTLINIGFVQGMDLILGEMIKEKIPHRKVKRIAQANIDMRLLPLPVSEKAEEDKLK